MKLFLICLCTFIAQIVASFSYADALVSMDPVALPLVSGNVNAGNVNADNAFASSESSVTLAAYQRPSTDFFVPYSPFGRVHTLGKNCFCKRPQSSWHVGAVARGFYLSDQRIQWSGVETTFAAEGALLADYQKKSGDWTTSVEGEFFINQPFEKNILLDTQERRSYAGNYDLDPLEFSRLNLAVRNGDWEVRAGKMWTPFGRHYSQLWSNSLIDAPFIRTEAIRWRETGALLRFDPAPWSMEVGAFNGSPNRDTNSAKGVIARVGAESTNWALGCSVKAQDGTGSENQKTFNRHAGIDAMVKRGRWRLSSEVIYDEYGLRRPVFDPLDIFWEKSIYYRDLNDGELDPISGVGYYLALDYTGESWLISLNYGQFFPETIGDARHDRTQNRGTLKVARSLGSHIQIYSIVMKENEGYLAQAGRPRRGSVVLTGLQYTY